MVKIRLINTWCCGFLYWGPDIPRGSRLRSSHHSDIQNLIYNLIIWLNIYYLVWNSDYFIYNSFITCLFLQTSFFYHACEYKTIPRFFTCKNWIFGIKPAVNKTQPKHCLIYSIYLHVRTYVWLVCSMVIKYEPRTWG